MWVCRGLRSQRLILCLKQITAVGNGSKIHYPLVSSSLLCIECWFTRGSLDSLKTDCSSSVFRVFHNHLCPTYAGEIISDESTDWAGCNNTTQPGRHHGLNLVCVKSYTINLPLRCWTYLFAIIRIYVFTVCIVNFIKYCILQHSFLVFLYLYSTSSWKPLSFNSGFLLLGGELWWVSLEDYITHITFSHIFCKLCQILQNLHLPAGYLGVRVIPFIVNKWSPWWAYHTIWLCWSNGTISCATAIKNLW